MMSVPKQYTQSFMYLPTSAHHFQHLNIGLQIREDGKNGPEWVPTKLLTRLTYTLSQMEGKVNIGNNGELHMKENEGGMDFNVLTVKVRLKLHQATVGRYFGKIRTYNSGFLTMCIYHLAQVPRGEEYPLMFSAKNLDVKGSADSMVGEFTVPPYRGSSFMDPRVRGPADAYDIKYINTFSIEIYCLSYIYENYKPKSAIRECTATSSYLIINPGSW